VLIERSLIKLIGLQSSNRGVQEHQILGKPMCHSILSGGVGVRLRRRLWVRRMTPKNELVLRVVIQAHIVYLWWI